jgi:DNA-directed RNA polymerase II subunit RPB11
MQAINSIPHKINYEDQPGPLDHILVEDGEDKVEEKISDHPNTSVFTVRREYYTLGNLLSQHLLGYNYILFAAYKIDDPLHAEFTLRVSTNGRQ